MIKMNISLENFSKLYRNYIITHINNKGLCDEDDYIFGMYYIKLHTDKYNDVDWSNYSSSSICQFDLGDAIVVDSMYSDPADDLFA